MTQIKDGGGDGDEPSYPSSGLKIEPTGFPDAFHVGCAEREE